MANPLLCFSDRNYNPYMIFTFFCMSITISELLDATLSEDGMRKMLEERIHL